MFKRLCYLVAEGFEICSISGYDTPDADANAKIVYRFQLPDGQWRIRSEEFYVEASEGEACGRLFLDYLQSEGLS